MRMLSRTLERWLAPGPIDATVLPSLIGCDPATLREFLTGFAASARRAERDLTAAIAAGQRATAKAVAHRLKSSARAVGAVALGELCARLEAATEHDDTVALGARAATFAAEVARVCNWIDAQQPLPELAPHAE